MKDSIDFGSMDISTLFRKLLVPTVLGMVFSAIFVITDGIFVGKGIGSDALAAVNITAPLFMIATGIGLMFGVGGSVVASIYLSQGKRKAANINITQALVFSTFIVLVMSALCFCFVGPLGCLLGSSDRLLPLVIEYMIWYLPFLVFYELLSTGMFFIRLDGSPNYAMMCNAIAAIFNIIFDYIFIFEFGWGMMGAAFATSLGTVVGGLMTVIYLTRFSRNIHLHRIKLSLKSLMLTLRNGGYMIKLGTSAFISEASIACMMFLIGFINTRRIATTRLTAIKIQLAYKITSAPPMLTLPSWIKKPWSASNTTSTVTAVRFSVTMKKRFSTSSIVKFTVRMQSRSLFTNCAISHLLYSTVADAANGLYFKLRPIVKAGAQPIYMNIYRFIVTFAVHAPDLIQQLQPGKGPFRVSQQLV